jgi:nicotinate-nucleotide adenylyltransferase
MPDGTVPARRVGVLGGSFDPVHLGHVKIARVVRETFELERVLLVPCAVPPHKPDRRLAAAEHRLRMLELAIAGDPHLEVSAVEIERGGVSYTIDTLRGMRDAPGGPACPAFILGMDALVDIEAWHAWDALVGEFDIIALDRTGPRSDESIPRLAPGIRRRLVSVPCEPGAGRSLLLRGSPGGRVFRVILEPIPISASEIRGRARRGEPLGGLVAEEVARYIQRSGLYAEEETR